MTAQFDFRKFRPDMTDTWNRFVHASKNATFLFDRGFMDYHSHQFEDYSLIVERDGKTCALFPANAIDDTLFSHGGLTYGGLLTDNKMSAANMVALFSAMIAYLRDERFKTLYYKAIPAIYHNQPAEEDIYALFCQGAELARVDVSATVSIKHRLPFSSGRKDGLRKAKRANIEVRQSTDWSTCWTLLTQALEDRHGAQPVHSLLEIESLAERFPEQIVLFGAFDGDQMVSALVIFDCGQTVHVQYIASSDQGRKVGGIDFIVSTLLEAKYADRTWFDFGISTTDEGRVLNEGLARQKEMFGARSTVYPHYRLDF